MRRNHDGGSIDLDDDYDVDDDDDDDYFDYTRTFGLTLMVITRHCQSKA